MKENADCRVARSMRSMRNLVKKYSIVGIAVCFLFICTLQGCAKSTVDIGAAVKQEQAIREEQTETSENQEPHLRQEVITTPEDAEEDAMRTITLTINNQSLTAELADNSSAEALAELLREGPLRIPMSDYGSMEKVGAIGTTLPTNDEQITTEAGDLILYMGNSFVIYYAPNSWNFTRLGKIRDVTADELKNSLGTGAVTVTLSLTA